MFNVSVHAMFRQETRWLKEWILYHEMIGVNHFFLLSNDDKPELEKATEILTPFIKRGLVTLKSYKKRDKSFQIEGVRYTIKNFADQTKWLCVIDLDEFILPAMYMDLYSILKQYEMNYLGGLHIPVSTFGTSGVKESPSNKTQIELFTKCGQKDCFANLTAKNFYRSEKIVELFDKDRNEHQMYDTNYQVSPKGKILRPSDVLRVNHYGTRSETDWKVKVERSNPAVENEDWKLKFARYNQNAVIDTTIQRYLPELKRLMSKV